MDEDFPSFDTQAAAITGCHSSVATFFAHDHHPGDWGFSILFPTSIIYYAKPHYKILLLVMYT